MNLQVEYLMKQAEAMAEDKRAWDALSQEIAFNCYPLRQFTQRTVFGPDFASMLMDSQPTNAREELGNTIDAMLRQGEWFQIGTGDDDRDHDAENARVLERATMMLRRAIEDPRMQFKTATKEADHDYVAFGQPLLTVEENQSRTFPLVRSWNPADACWAYDDDGEHSVVYRKVDVPAQTVAGYIKRGRWNGTLSSTIEAIASKNPWQKVKLLHCLIKTEDLYGSDGPKMRQYARSPYLSIYIDCEGKEKLHERGEPMDMYLTPRWRALSGHTYGFSPAGLNSLPDMRMLQMLSMIILEQGEKGLDPPMIGSAEVFTRDMNFYSGGFTYVDLPEDRSLQDMMTTLDTSRGFDKGLELKQDLRSTIMDAWLLNKLYLPRVSDMRELEVATRNEEFRRAALPFFSPIDNDYHPKLLGRLFDRLVMMRLIPREMFPESLGGTDLHFTFQSPLNEVDGQRIFESYNKAVSAIAAGTQVDETVGLIFNMKQATEDAVRGAGAKGSWIFSGREREQKTEEANQAQQLAQASQIINQTASTTQNVAAAKQAADVTGLTG